MNTDLDKPQNPPIAAQPPAQPVKPATKGMNAGLYLKELQNQIKKLVRRVSKHAAFLGVMIVLLAYLFIVWQISQLANAEPAADDSAIAETRIPKVDPKAINQIQALEQNNTQVHSLFNSAPIILFR